MPDLSFFEKFKSLNERSDRRIFSRLSLHLPATIHREESEIPCIVKNISAEGVYLETKDYKEGTELTDELIGQNVHFEIGKSKPSEYKAQIVRVEKYEKNYSLALKIIENESYN